MKKTVSNYLFILFISLVSLTKAQVNLGFETGDFTGWTGTVGNTSIAGQVTPVYTNTIWTQGVNAGMYTQSYHTIMSTAAGNDYFGNFPIVPSGAGNFTARLGNVGTNVNGTGGSGSCTGVNPAYYCPKHTGYVGPTQPPFSGAESIEQTFLVTSANAMVTLKYAAVFNNGSHSGGAVVNPFFKAEVLDNLGNPVPCLTYTFVLNKSSLPSGAGSTGSIRPCWMASTSSSSITVYMPWQQKIFDLTSKIGTNVTVRFSAGGCDEGGHFGYAYVDASAGPKELIQTGGSGCSGPKVLSGPTQYGSSYSWAGPAGGITAQSANTATVNTTGTYSLTVGSGSCAITFTTYVNLTAPTIALAASGQTVCSGSTLTGHTFNASPSGATVTWTNTNTNIGLAANGSGDIGSYTAPIVTSQQIGVVTAIPSYSGCTGSAKTFTYVINPYPNLTPSSSQTITCANNTATLTGTSTTPGTTYSWSPGGSTPTSSATTVNSAGNYTITASVGSCRTSSVITISSSTTPPSVSINASGTGTICSGNGTITLTANGADTYTWNPGGTGNSINVSPGSTTTYTVTGTNAVNGCTNQAVNTITVSPTPTISINTIASASPSICIGSSVGLTAGGAASYTWSPGTGLSGTTGQTVTANPSSTQTYIAVGTSSAGCVSTAASSASFVVTVNPLPNVGINATNSGSLCSGSTLTLTGTGANTYTWNPGGSGNTISVSPSGNTDYTVTGTSAAGCTNTAITTVTVSPTPTININTIASASPSICIGSSVGLTAGGAATFTWSPGTGLSSTTGQTVSANPLSTQTYIAVGTSSAGCTSTAASSASFVVTVNPLPTPVIAGNTTLTCSSPTISYSVSPGAGHTYTWTGSGVTGNANNSSIDINQPGTLDVSITNTLTGCTGSTSISISQNTVAPTVTVSPGSFSTTCASPTVQLTANASTGVTYSWTPPSTGSLNNSTTQNPVASGSGVFTVQVTDTQNGCVSVIDAFSTATITADANTPIVTLSASNLSLTCTSSVQSVTVSSATSGLSYTWTPSPASGQNSATPTFTAAGNYSVAVDNPVTGCSTSANVTITSNTLAPVVSSVASNSLNCTTTTVQAVASTTSSPVSYSWSGPGIISGQGNDTITVNAGGSYQYTITDTNNGCISAGSLSITQNTVMPTLTVSPTSFTITCASPTVQLSANGSSGSLTYTWTSPATGSLDNSGISNPIATGHGDYTVVATDPSNNCTSAQSISTVVPDVNTPTVSLSANSVTLTCASLTQTVTASSSMPDLTYNWIPAPSSGNGTSSPVFTTPGTYVGTITNTVNGCSSNATITVSSNTVSPVISGINTNATSGSTITCTNATLSYTATASSGSNINWDGPSGPIAGNPVDISEPGNYTVTVTDPVNGCNTNSVITISSDTVAPSITNASSSADSINCANPTVSLNANATSTNVSYTWNGPGGYSSTQQNPNGISTAGSYTIVVMDNFNGCTTSSVVTITQGTNPTAGFTATPVSGNTPLVVDFTNTSSGGFNSFGWDFNNGQTSTQTNPQTTYNTPGTYTVILVGIANNPNCNDTVTGVITVSEDNVLEIPNVFTPNGDGSNEVFYLTTKGYNDIHMEIFNRWGQRLAVMDGLKSYWDGKSPNGEKVPDGTYFYLLKATKTDGGEVEKQGFITLIR